MPGTGSGPDSAEPSPSSAASRPTPRPPPRAAAATPAAGAGRRLRRAPLCPPASLGPRAVGVTPPAVYLHFADKRELVSAVLEHVFADLGRALEDADHGEPRQRVRAILQACVTWGLVHPGRYKISYEGAIARQLPPDAERQFGRPLLQRLATAVRAIQPRDPMRTATRLWTCAHGVVSLRLNKPHAPLGDPIEDTMTLTDALLQHH